MKKLKILLLLTVLSSCGRNADRTTINHITTKQPLDAYDLENLHEMFYSQCRGIFNKIVPEEAKANRINKCVAERMEPFILEFRK